MKKMLQFYLNEFEDLIEKCRAIFADYSHVGQSLLADKAGLMIAKDPILTKDNFYSVSGDLFLNLQKAAKVTAENMAVVCAAIWTQTKNPI